MDDLWKNLAMGLFAFTIVHGCLEQRARRDAGRLAREAFEETGHVEARVAPRGLLGVFASDFYAVDVTGVGVVLDKVPFAVIPREGWKGSVRHLRVHLKDFRLRGVLVRALEADIPFVTYDIGNAVWKDRLVLRGSGVGAGRVEIDSDALGSFVSHKYENILSDVRIFIKPKSLTLSGKVTLFGPAIPFVASGRLEPRDGRFLDLVGASVSLNGQSLSPTLANRLMDRLNPVLNAEQDLGLSGFFEITKVEFGDDLVTIRGQVSLPKR